MKAGYFSLLIFKRNPENTLHCTLGTRKIVVQFSSRDPTEVSMRKTVL